jgi:hypothetical protein
VTHTPGPWEKDDVWIQSKGDTIAEVWDNSNAHLIAAAPDLLEALKSLANEATGFLAMADPTAHGQTNLKCLDRRIEAARAAIAKAEGR